MASLANIFELSQGGAIAADGPLAEQISALLVQEFSHEKMQEQQEEQEKERLEPATEGIHQLLKAEQMGWLAHFQNHPGDCEDHDPTGLMYALDPEKLSSEELMDIAAARALMSKQQVHNSVIVYVRPDQTKVTNVFTQALEDFAQQHGLVVCKSVPELVRRYFR